MPDDKPKKKDFWDIIQAIGPAIIAATVGIVGTMYNNQQAQIAKTSEQREVYTKIMTERESSDNAIRAKMFEMLFNAMFTKQAISAGEPGDNIRQIKQQVMFLDVLSRNFDTVDIKPLFEDMDNELTKKIYNDQAYSDKMQGDYFAMRAELRRIGKNLCIKQLNALASLPGTHVKRVVILESKDGKMDAIPDESSAGGNGDTMLIDIKPESIADGMVELTMNYLKSKSTDPNFKAPSFVISFYDLPYIDNSVIDKDMRIGIVLTKYVAVRDLDLFRDRMDKKLIKDYEDLKAGGIAKYAEIRLIQFPAKYTGHRDRPYLSDILQNLVPGDQPKPNMDKPATTK